MPSRCTDFNRTKTVLPTPHGYRLRRSYTGSPLSSTVQMALTRRFTPPHFTYNKQNTSQGSIGSPYPAVFFALVFSLSRTVDLVRALSVALGPYPMRVIRANASIVEASGCFCGLRMKHTL